MKICRVCQNELSESMFPRRTNGKLRNECFDCTKNLAKQYYLQNQAERLKMASTYRENNRLKLAKASREYYSKNKKFVLIKNRERKRKRLASDPIYRMVENLRNRLRKAIYGHQKADTTMNLVGCSRDHLINHIESKFQDDMSWENYGKWHLDHIIACSKFNLSEQEEQKKCFHYTNIQPLWAKDNLKKGNK